MKTNELPSLPEVIHLDKETLEAIYSNNTNQSNNK